MNKSNLDFDKQLCYCACLREMFEVNYLRGKSNLRFLTVVLKVVLTELFFKMQFVKNVLVYVFGVFTFSFCYSFYEGFTHEIILVSLFLPFICISYPLRIFKFDTGILRDACAVPLLQTLSRLPQNTLGILIFAGTFFREFRVFWPLSRN